MEQFRLLEDILATCFGKKFCFKFQAIVKEVTSMQLVVEGSGSSSSSALTIPSSLWPLPQVQLVPVLQPDLKDFEQAYAAKFHKRKVKTTLPWLGRVELRYKGKFNIHVSGFQAQVLLLFNRTPKMSLDWLIDKIGIS